MPNFALLFAGWLVLMAACIGSGPLLAWIIGA